MYFLKHIFRKHKDIAISIIAMAFLASVYQVSAAAGTTIGTNILTTGSLTIDGALKFQNGASDNFILRTDASGNASWASVGSTLSDAGLGIGDAGGIAPLDGSSFVPMANLPVGIPDGVASLDAGGKVPVTQLPTFVAAAASFQGTWDASSNTPTLTPNSNVSGDYYVVSVSGTTDLACTPACTSWDVGDWAVFNGMTWGRVPGINTVFSVFDRTGAVVAEDNDYTWAQINKTISSLADLTDRNISDTTGTLEETRGGTNQTSYAVGDILYASAANILSKLGIGSDNQVLTIIGGVPIWQNPASGFTNPMTTRGDIIYRDSNNDTSRLGIGSAGQVLTSDGADVSWATPTNSGFSLSSVIAAITGNTINNGDNAQVWNWSLSTADQTGIVFGENTASTATGKPAIVQAGTQPSSTAIPLYLKNLGNGNSFRVDDESSDTTPFMIDNSGNVAIGSDFFAPGALQERLKVEGIAGHQSVVTANGDINTGLFMTVKNRNSGASASSAMVQASDNFAATPAPVNLTTTGITSSGYNNPANTILGPNESFVASYGNGLTFGTVYPAKPIKFATGGTLAANERMRIDGSGNVGINTTAPGSKLDVKGEFRLSGSTSGYVGFLPPAVAGATTYTLPSADGISGDALVTNGSGTLSWSTNVSKFQRVGTVLSPIFAGDDITTSGNIYTTGAGAITSAGLLTGSAGLTASGADVNLNANSNHDTNINTGTSTGSVAIGNSLAGPIVIRSASTITLQGGANTITTPSSDIKLQPAGTSATGSVQIGEGGVGSATPDLLALDIKSDAGDPTGFDGAMYYNDSEEEFKCFINGSWGNCDTTGGTATLQSAYNESASIITSGSVPIDFTLTSGDFNVTGASAVNITPTSASQFTSGGALTLTGGAASTWGTASGDLTLQTAGTGITSSVKIGAGGAGSTSPDLLGLDVKSTTGDPAGYNGATYYSNFLGKFRCYESGGWKDCDTGAGASSTLQQAYVAGATITTESSTDLAFTLASGSFTAAGAGSVLLTPSGASSFTSGGALTLTGGAASTWSTSSGSLTIDSADALNLGATNATSLSIGRTSITTTNNGSFTSTQSLTASNGLALTTGALSLTATSGVLALSGLSASSISTGANSLALIGSPININTTGTGTTNIGSATSVINLPGLTISKAVFTDASKNLTSTGTVGIDQGGTGQTTQTTAFNALSPLTTKGDLIVHNGTNNIRLPVGGVNGNVLTVDSTQTAGIKWAAGSTGTVTSISGSGGTTGLTLTGGPITTSGTLTLGGILAVANGGSQWTTTGSDIYYNTGNVGVGTVTPQGKLEVHSVSGSQADLYITTNTNLGSGSVADLVFQSDSDGTPNLATIGQFNDGALRFSGGASLFTPDMIILDSGNVGIGDVSPASLLTVGSGDLFQVDSSGNPVKIRNVTYSWPSAQGGASTVLTNNGSGTLSWTAAGNGTVTSFSSGNLSPLFTTSVATATTTPALSFTISNAAANTILGNNTGSAAAPAYFTPTLASALFANQGTTTQVLHGNASGNPSWSAVSLTADVSGILPAANGGSQWTTTGSDIYYNTGKVGVGTTAPWSTFIAKSPAIIAPEVSLTNHTPSIASFAATNTGTELGIFAALASPYTMSLQTRLDGGSNSSFPLALNPLGGNVGIGTATPASKLDVEGGLAIGATYSGTTAAPTNGAIIEGSVGIGTTSPGMKLHITSGSSPGIRLEQDNSQALGAQIWDLVGNNGNFAIRDTTNGILPFRIVPAAPANSLYIAANGNTGIGTSTPSQRLAVEGTFGILEGGATPSFHSIFQGGDQAGDITYTLPTAQGGASTILTNNGSGTLSWAASTASQWITNGSDIYYNTGKVGIGINPPLYPLHVSGAGNQAIKIASTNNTEAAVIYENLSSIQQWKVGLAAGTGSGKNFEFYDATNAATRLTIEGDATGNVGIGTSDPSSKLHVVGSTLHTGSTTLNGAFNFATDAGSTDAYAITLSPPPTAYTAGMMIVFTANTANTGAATINVNGLGAKNIVKGNNAALATNDIIVNRTYIIVYDGTQFDLINPAVQ